MTEETMEEEFEEAAPAPASAMTETLRSDSRRDLVIARTHASEINRVN